MSGYDNWLCAGDPAEDAPDYALVEGLTDDEIDRLIEKCPTHRVWYRRDHGECPACEGIIDSLEVE